MKHGLSLRLFILLVATVLLVCSGATIAQDLPEGAKVNKDKCLGYDMDYKKYPKPVIAKVQADMYQLYHLDTDWKHDAGLKGKPLNDGILGPITWSWMQRLCNSFALDETGDVLKALPDRLDALARFSEKFPADSADLISKPFTVWAQKNQNACELVTRNILSAGSDEQLQLLLRCYRQPASEPVHKPKPVTAYYPNSLFVLRGDDYDAMAQVSTQIGLAHQLTEKTFPDKDAAATAMLALFKDLPSDTAKTVSNQLLAQMQMQEHFALTDIVLDELYKSGIGDDLFAQLQALPEKTFSNKSVFDNTISKAIVTAQEQELLRLTPATEPATDSSQASSLALPRQANPQALLLQIQLASRTTFWILPESVLQDLAKSEGPLPEPVIQLLKPLQDLEYPEGELLHLAAQNKLLKGLGLCQLDKSNTDDRLLGKIDDNARNELLALINKKLPEVLRSKGQFKPCSELHVKAMSDFYDEHFRQTIERLYREDMPAYSGKPIRWTGDGCGCVPREIQTTAYGIFPYWKITDNTQLIDFSTYSRVGYFGLSASHAGELFQINATNKDSTLLNINTPRPFIEDMRRYGSKLDWIIEKDWSQFPYAETPEGMLALDNFYARLKEQLTHFVSAPLREPLARLRPLYTLGLSGSPMNGDGITLYFRNYPQTKHAKEKFDDFFRSLKNSLETIDNDRNRFHQIKQNTYLNVMVSKQDFVSDFGAFSGNNLELLTNTAKYKNANLSMVETQEATRSLIILLMESPYYSGLDEIYALTTSNNRTIIAPLMIDNYTHIGSGSGSTITHTNIANVNTVDEREKRLAYLHESFGGGAFWPLTQFDDKAYARFNEYIFLHFSPGYIQSFWIEKACVYRWQLIALLNLWLIAALVYLLVVFFLYPHQCRKLPTVIAFLPHPLTVMVVILPPIILWAYLLLENPSFSFLSLTSVLGVAIIGLAVKAAINAVDQLRQQKPNRNLLSFQKSKTVPERMPNDSDQDKLDDSSQEGEVQH